MNTPQSPVSSPQSPPAKQGRGRPDHGSPRAALIALIFSILLFLAVMGFQQFRVQQLGDKKVDPAASTETSIFNLYAKGFTKAFGTAFAANSDQDRGTVLLPVTKEINQLAQTPDEKLKVAIVTAELANAQQAIQSLESTQQWVQKRINENKADPNRGFELKDEDRAKFNENRELLLRHYRSSLAPESSEDAVPLRLNAAEIATLKERFGWFGRLAAVYGDKDAADRKALFDGGQWIIVLTVLMGVGFSLAILAGFGLFITAIVLLATGRITPRFRPPSPGGSVYLETLAVFVAAFFGMQLLLMGLAAVLFSKDTTEFPRWFSAMHLGLQWLLALIPLYPLLRGVSFPQWRDDIGFVAPTGVWREIGIGILAYLAGLPIFLFGLLITLILKFAWETLKASWGHESSGPATNPIFDEILSSDPLSLILLVALATIWAPFVEESIFRGALFRHLRSRQGLLIAGIISAVVFGGMHGYEVVLLGPVISLGFVFALMREWRKSIIPSITAHMLHNGTVITIAIIMIRLISK